VRHLEVRRGSYVDSVALMQVSKLVSALDGVTTALVAMGTELNLELVAGMGFEVPPVSPNEMVVAVEATSEEAVAAAVGEVDLADRKSVV